MRLGQYGIRIAFTTLAAAAAIAAGCAAEREVVRPAVGISGETFRAGGVAVAGVTVIEEVEQVRPPLIATLERTMKADRPDIHFRSADSVRAALGLPAYRRLLSAYQASGSLKPAEMKEISAALGAGTRYVILARVEKNATRESGRLKQGEPQMMAGLYTVSRDARIRFTLYDVAEQKTAFEATYASSSENGVPDSLRYRAPRAVEVTARTAEPPDLNPDVRAPDLALALVEAFKAFAADLPR